MTSRNIQYESPALAAFYREHRTRWTDFYESERVMFSRLAPGPETAVLDIGCGCGGLGMALREQFGVNAYTGVEINPQAAEAGRLLNPASTIITGDILALGQQLIPEGSFDLVVSLGCIDFNVEFDAMLARAFDFVRPGGHFVSSFRITPETTADDMRTSYQYINFDGRQEGEIAPYVVMNGDALLDRLRRLDAAGISGFGYWGTPSKTAVTPVSRIGFAVIAVRKRSSPGQPATIDLDVPDGMFTAAA